MPETQPLDSSDPKWEDLSDHKTLTCRNHPNVRYTTKNPWIRTVFVKSGSDECQCPFDDLVEVVSE